MYTPLEWEMDRFITRTKRTDLRTDLPKELPVLGKSTARPWKGALSPKTPGNNKRKEPVRHATIYSDSERGRERVRESGIALRSTGRRSYRQGW